MDATWGRQKVFCALALVAALFVTVSAWDEDDAIAEAKRARMNLARYLAEVDGDRELRASDFHCRTPLKGERLVMQHASPRDPGKGYRCTYWLTTPRAQDHYATVTWSRSPDVLRSLPEARP